ncbi:RNA polymerase sigma-70 factor (ECF subfamily) [Nakamurella sp. UYEF19]|uniref:sigma-70 family RNA polymerase sigma factor n=1 Tax=Nakamurella sp. UYEF19 TaxID=1756392 RepID=UPI003395479E
MLVTEGDLQAFDQLYRAEFPSVRALVFRMLRDFHQAEEVAQEVFLEVWRLASRFDPSRGSGHSWIMRMARLRAIDRVRRCEAARQRDQAHSDCSQVRDFDVVEETALLRAEGSRVQTALLDLTAVQREALVLGFFSTMSYPEIAVFLGVPLGTLKTRIRDALIKLRAVLAPEPTTLADAA